MSLLKPRELTLTDEEQKRLQDHFDALQAADDALAADMMHPRDENGLLTIRFTSAEWCGYMAQVHEKLAARYRGAS